MCILRMDCLNIEGRRGVTKLSPKWQVIVFLGRGDKAVTIIVDLIAIGGGSCITMWHMCVKYILDRVCPHRLHYVD